MKLTYATLAAIAMMWGSAAALPIDPRPSAPAIGVDAPIVSVAYGHYRRVARRTTRRAVRRGYYGRGYYGYRRYYARPYYGHYRRVGRRMTRRAIRRRYY